MPKNHTQCVHYNISVDIYLGTRIYVNIFKSCLLDKSQAKLAPIHLNLLPYHYINVSMY